ncbi:YD repeat-containing protein [Natronoarchaeum philippinense]|uniref:YD repeat-containing protein n=1 Tax=Natronoarchaeum philippinense TaxID=558529 RepID=A0A285N624_NATPI|nr:NRDE family protein [Natronoarchaeum philippinense]SNZ04934.1 YD repeat-containing protein [Natronoarchaeum philippinense]
MCTLTLAWQVFPETPVAVAANRDEADSRPSEPPAVIDRDPRVVAPRDADAGGTWIGYNEHGLLVAITNRWNDADLAGERSRGLLVRDALRRPTAEAAGRFVEAELRAREYEGFNLVIADAAAALYYEWSGSLDFRQLDPGVHVVVNVGADGQFSIPQTRPDAGERQAESAAWLREALAVEPGETATAWTGRAADALADHTYGVCVHGDGFGTRSSSLIALGDSGATYRFADGPPCETDYEDVALDLG